MCRVRSLDPSSPLHVASIKLQVDIPTVILAMVLWLCASLLRLCDFTLRYSSSSVFSKKSLLFEFISCSFLCCSLLSTALLISFSPMCAWLEAICRSSGGIVWCNDAIKWVVDTVSIWGSMGVRSWDRVVQHHASAKSTTWSSVRFLMSHAMRFTVCELFACSTRPSSVASCCLSDSFFTAHTH